MERAVIAKSLPKYMFLIFAWEKGVKGSASKGTFKSHIHRGCWHIAIDTTEKQP